MKLKDGSCELKVIISEKVSEELRIVELLFRKKLYLFLKTAVPTATTFVCFINTFCLGMLKNTLVNTELNQTQTFPWKSLPWSRVDGACMQIAHYNHRLYFTLARI